jgi:phage terminase Nu1 subunit (DNA packaging protein)
MLSGKAARHIETARATGSGNGDHHGENDRLRCPSIEISPAYADVAYQRWQDFTGGHRRVPWRLMVAEGVPPKTLAVLLDMSEASVRQHAAEGVFVKAGRGQYLLAPSVRNYVRRLREIAAGRQGNELNAVDENARLKIAQRRNYELKNAMLEGSTVPVEAIAPAWGRVMRAVRTGMLAVPNKARFRLQHLTAQDAEALDEIIRDQLEAAAATDTPPQGEA